MQRRAFLKKTSVSAVAFGVFPTINFSSKVEYTTEELMGKADIKLFGEGINLRKEAHDAYVAMKKAAYADGFDMKMVSSYRSFERQRTIFERKFLRFTDDGLEPMDAILKIVEYSTIPGTSRHHWGTEVDIIDGYPKSTGDVLVPEKFEGNGPFAPFKKWLDENSKKFDYHIVYTDSILRKGFKYEPWHYSYAPLSIPMLEQFREKNILKLISDENFEGCEHFTTAFLRDYIHNNILDINPYLL